MSTSSSKSISIKAEYEISFLEFSPFLQSSELFAYGCSKFVTVLEINESLQEPREVIQLPLGNNRNEILTFAWSPKANIRVIPRSIRFAISTSDMTIKIYTTDLGQEHTTIDELEGHTSFINDVQYERTNGDILASVGDDLSLRLWNEATKQQISLIKLTSPGMSLRWHPADSSKIIVAEKCGVIRLYSIDSQHPVMSLDTGHVPLMSCDWCPSNHQLIGAAAGSEWIIWDLTQSSQLIEKQHTDLNAVLEFRWCAVSDQIFAVTGRQGNQVKIYQRDHRKTPLSKSFLTPSKLSWHCKLPVCAMGGHREIDICAVEA